MATALIAWFSAPAPTTWTSTPPACRTAPAIAPATEFGLDLVETLSVSIGAPRWAWRELSAYRCVIRRQHGAFLPLPRADLSFSRSCARRVTPLGSSYRRLKAATDGMSTPRRRPSVVERDGLVEISELVSLLRRDAVAVDADLGEDALGDLHHDLRVLAQEGLGVLTALTELLAFVGEPRPRLLDDAEIDTDVEQRTFAADALPIHDVELRLTERRRHLVLHDLDARAIADDLGGVLDRLDAADVEPHRRIELQRAPTRRGFGRAEHHTDFFAQLVDEDADGVRLVEVGGELAQCLRDEPGLQTHVGVAHLAFDLGAGRESGVGVDDHHVERAGTDERVGDLERLLAGVGLGDQQLVDVDADGPRVYGIHRVLGVDVGADATVALRLGDGMHGQCRLAGRLRAEDLDDPASRQAADSERQVEGECSRGDGLDGHLPLVTHFHHGTLAVLLLDLGHGHFEGLLSLHRVSFRYLAFQAMFS